MPHTDPSTLTRAQLLQSYWKFKLDAAYWRTEYQRAVKHDGRIIDALTPNNRQPS